MSMFATLYFIASLPSMSTEQVAANAEGASASSAAVTRNLRIMGRTSRGGSVGSRPRLAKDNVNYSIVQTCSSRHGGERIQTGPRCTAAPCRMTGSSGLMPGVLAHDRPCRPDQKSVVAEKQV